MSKLTMSLSPTRTAPTIGVHEDKKDFHDLRSLVLVQQQSSPEEQTPKSHRKTKSASAASFIDVFRSPLQRNKAASTSTTPTNGFHRRSHTLSPGTAGANSILTTNPGDSPLSLAIPSLAKPTSFLTGKEMATMETTWPVEIPAKSDVLVLLKLAKFMENYREEAAINLQELVGRSKLELKSFAIGNKNLKLDDTHRKIVENLLDCFETHDNVQIHAFMCTEDDPMLRREIMILERQNTFICICRGSTAEQQGKWKPEEPVTLPEGATVERYSAFQDLEKTLFATLDRMVDESPFCDVCFTGHSGGAAMASIAAFRYATARPQLRVSCIVAATPKVGDEQMRLLANGLVNLKAFRLEINRPKEATSFGHTIRLGKTPKAYRFGESEPSKFKLFNRMKDISDFVNTVEGYESWVKDYYREDGAGVRGEGDEIRQVV